MIRLKRLYRFISLLLIIGIHVSQIHASFPIYSDSTKSTEPIVLKEFNGKEISATDIVPRQANIDDFKIGVYGPYRNSYGHNEYKLTYSLTFKDSENERNYYFLKLEFPHFDEDNDGPGNSGFIDFSQEFVFQKLEKELGLNTDKSFFNKYGLPFSDNGINGQTHTIVFTETLESLFNLDSAIRRIKLYAISEPYYKYLVDTMKFESSSDTESYGIINLGMADPIAVFSNVENGLGLLGSYTVAKKVAKLKLY